MPQLSPDGRFVVYADDVDVPTGVQADLYVVATTGHGRPRRLTNDPKIEQTPVWSPDGKAMAFTVYNPRSGSYRGAYVMDVQGGTPRLISREGSAVAWSPDGRRLALVTNDLYLTDLRGRVIRWLAKAPSNGIFGVSWAPSQTIAYVGDRGDSSQGKCRD